MNTIKISNPTEFLALIPQLLGYTPMDSIVVVPFVGNRSAGALRLDIPTHDMRGDLVNLAVSLIARIDRADGVAVAIYAEEHTAHAALAATLVTEFSRAGYDVHDTMYATAEGGGSYGREPAPIPANATVTGDQHAAATLPEVPAARAQAIQAATSLDISTLLPEGDSAAEHLFAVIDHALAVNPEDMDAEDAGQVICLLSNPALRDVAIATWCHGSEAGQTTLAYQLAWSTGTPLPECPVILAGEGGRPDGTRLQRASALTRYLAAAVTGTRERAAMLGTAAWLAWALGSCTAADDLATAALAVNEHGLAEIVQELARRGTLPEWAFTA